MILKLSSYNYFEKDETKIGIINDINQWANDDDYDDYVEIFDNTYKINYKFIISLFMLHINNNFNYKSSYYIHGLIEYLKEDMDKFKLLLENTRKSVNRLVEIYHSNFISFNSYLKIIPHPDLRNLHLYTGFNYEGYKPLMKLMDSIFEKNKIITIPSIISSSINKKVAERFCRGHRRIIWKVVVPKHKFKSFKYSYIKANYQYSKSNIDTINISNITSEKEHEFLLNYGIQLKCIEKIIDDDTEILIFQFHNYQKPDLNDFNKFIHELS
jgi:hypothetical protein